MLDKKFWSATGERAVRAFAGALVALLATGVSGVLDVDWVQALSVAALAAVVSFLTSLAASGVGEPGPSLGKETLTVDQPVTVDIPIPAPVAFTVGEKVLLDSGVAVQDRAERTRISKHLAGY